MANEAQAEEAARKNAAENAAELPAGASAQVDGNLDFVLEVPLRVTVQIGGARMLVRDVLQLSQGSVVELDRLSGEPADILVNDRLVARGEVTVIEERMAVRVVEVLEGDRLSPSHD
jgi:flagellar motor switch protein FliN/FliY